MEIQRRIVLLLILLSSVVVFGIIGYMLIEGWPLLDAVYMTVITMTTVGFGEVRPLSNGGMIFTIVLVVGGAGVILYGISNITAIIVEGQLRDILRRRHMERAIKVLKDHYILCGCGQTGIRVAREFLETKKRFVIVEKEPSKIERLGEINKLLYIQGDATQDEILLTAGVKNAKGLVSALPKDKDNVFVVLSARNMNPGLRIVARAETEESGPKLKRAGADAVVFPTFIGGLRMASEMLRPQVVEFLDVMMRGKDMTLRIEEVEIHPGSRLAGKTLGEIEIPQKTGLIVVAIKESESGTYRYNPHASFKLKELDILIVLGEISHVKTLRKMIGEGVG